MTGAEMMDLGRALWGAPNMRLSSKEEARFGSNGSKMSENDLRGVAEKWLRAAM